MNLRILRQLAFACTLSLPSANAARAMTLPLHLDERAVFTIGIRNATAHESAATFRADPVVSGNPGAYALSVLPPSPCELTGGTLGGSPPPQVYLRAAPIPAQSVSYCTFLIHRAPDSGWPAFLRFEADSDTPSGLQLTDPHWQFGPLVDVSLESRQVAPFPKQGELTGILEITIRNHSTWDIDRVDFGECQGPAIAPFSLDNALPGGCADAKTGPTCFAVGPPSIQFGMTGLPAGATRTCLLRATAHEPLVQPRRFQLRLVEEWPLTSGKEWLFDYESSNDNALLELAPVGVQGDGGAVPVPLGRGGLLLLGLLIALSALAHFRYRDE